MIKKLIVLSTSLLIIGFSSTPQEKRLDQYLEDTKTDAKERSIDWYYKHDYERSNVLNICYSIYIDSAKKAGYYSDDVSDGREKYLDDSVQKEMYASNDECNKAYKAQDILDNFVASNSLPQESYEDKLDPQQEPNSTPEVSPEVPEVSPEAPANEPVATKPPTLEELTNANPQ